MRTDLRGLSASAAGLTGMVCAAAVRPFWLRLSMALVGGCLAGYLVARFGAIPAVRTAVELLLLAGVMLILAGLLLHFVPLPGAGGE